MRLFMCFWDKEFEVQSARVEESAVTHRRPDFKDFQILKVCLEQTLAH